MAHLWEWWSREKGRRGMEWCLSEGLKFLSDWLSKVWSIEQVDFDINYVQSKDKKKKKDLDPKDPSFSSSLSVCAHLHQVSGDLCSSRSEGSSKIESWTSCGQVFLCCWLISVSSFRDTGGAALAFNRQPFQVLCQLMESSTEACHLKNRSLGIPKIGMPLYSHDELVTWDHTS